MKKSITILMLLFFSIGYAQLYPSEIILTNGDTINGIGKIAGNKFKYKLEEDSKSKKIEFYSIDKVTIRYSDEVVATYKYINVKEVNGYGFYVLRVIQSGKVDLYSMEYPHDIYSATNNYGPFYVKRENAHYATNIRPKGGLNADYIKAALPYLNNCEIFVDNVFKGKFEKKDLSGMIKFYNENCQ